MQLLTLLVTESLYWKGLLKGNSCTLRRYIWMPLLTLFVTKTLYWKGLLKVTVAHSDSTSGCHC